MRNRGSPRTSQEQGKTPPSSSTCSRSLCEAGPHCRVGEDVGLLVQVGPSRYISAQPWWGPGHRQCHLLLHSAMPDHRWCPSAPPDIQQGNLDGRHKQFMVELTGKRSRWYLQPTWPVSSPWAKAGCNFTIEFLSNPRIKRKIHP